MCPHKASIFKVKHSEETIECSCSLVWVEESSLFLSKRKCEEELNKADGLNGLEMSLKKEI